MRIVQRLIMLILLTIVIIKFTACIDNMDNRGDKDIVTNTSKEAEVEIYQDNKKGEIASVIVMNLQIIMSHQLRKNKRV